MKAMKSVRGRVAIRVSIVFASLLCGLLMFCAISPTVMAQTPTKPAPAPTLKKPLPMQAVAKPTPAVWEAWRKTILKTPRPKKDACFTANYPDTQWREIPCIKPPNKLYPPPPRHGTKSVTVGDGSTNDFSAQVTSGAISEAEGSFGANSTVTGECAVQCTITSTGIICPSNPSCAGSTDTNAYSLQVNTASFYGTSACSGSPNGTTAPNGCQGWEQFVYDSSGGGFIQYWLLHWGPPAGSSGYKPCPSPHGTGCVNGSVNSTGWCEQALYGETYCAVNAVKGVPSIPEPVTKLGDFKVTAYANGAGGMTTDSVAVSVSGGQPVSAPGNNYFPDLGSTWKEVEFNVFGDGGGDQAVFDAGSTLQVTTSVVNNTTNAPLCEAASFTGETNSLTLAPAQGTTSPPVCCPYGGANPAIEFVESNNATEWAACGNTTITWGEPHITTVDGTYYDFQGAGEYITLQDPDGTEVQVRQTPIPTDAPGDWVPNPPPAKYQDDGLLSCLSGNTAVAARVGTHRVTYEPCFGGGACNTNGLQLRIDGKVATQGANFGDGGSAEITTEGVEIHFPDGKILNVSGSLPLLGLELSGVGVVSKSAGASESGLGGFVPDKNWLPRLPNGAPVGPMPASLHDRYVTLNKTFGNAWRVTNSNSLFDYAPGTSTATFTHAAWPVENAKTCTVPNVKTTPHISAEAAEEACKSITNATLHSSCVFDVKMTGITHLADTYKVTELVHNKVLAKPILIKPNLQ